MQDVRSIYKYATPAEIVLNVDSAMRDKRVWKSPSKYEVTFNTPFTNVFAVDILSGIMPRMSENVFDYNNSLVVIYDGTEYEVFLPIGYYTGGSLAQGLQDACARAGCPLQISLDVSRNSDYYIFSSSVPFSILAYRSTIRDMVGLNAPVDPLDTLAFGTQYTSVPGYKDGDPDEFVAVQRTNGRYYMGAPYAYNLISVRYILIRCEEIERYLYRDRAGEKSFMSMARFDMVDPYLNTRAFSFNNSLPTRVIHPISRLDKLTLSFWNSNTGRLMDFRGLDHVMTVVIRYYEFAAKTRMLEEDPRSNWDALNPRYDPDPLRWQAVSNEAYHGRPSSQGR